MRFADDDRLRLDDHRYRIRDNGRLIHTADCPCWREPTPHVCQVCDVPLSSHGAPCSQVARRPAWLRWLGIP